LSKLELLVIKLAYQIS